MAKLELKLYQIEVEEMYHDGHPYTRKYCIFAPNDESAENSAKNILARWKDKMKLKSMEIKLVKEVTPIQGRMLIGGME